MGTRKKGKGLCRCTCLRGRPRLGYTSFQPSTMWLACSAITSKKNRKKRATDTQRKVGSPNNTASERRARVAEPLSRKYSGNAIGLAVRGSNPGSHIRYAQETWRNPGENMTSSGFQDRI
eukprot:1161059-Pelagomonas_calceolata.AAC.13